MYDLKATCAKAPGSSIISQEKEQADNYERISRLTSPQGLPLSHRRYTTGLREITQAMSGKTVLIKCRWGRSYGNDKSDSA
jgi:hypothetical protein